MKILEEKILKEAKVLPGGIVKVDSFLNQQLDIALFDELGKEWYSLFKNEGVTKILTIEASGIALAAMTARHFLTPVVYAKKSRSPYGDKDHYHTRVISYTHGGQYSVTVAKEFISPDDKVLIIDDFLANGSALRALIDICSQAGATVVGAGIAVEKAYNGGADKIRADGYRVESLSKIVSAEEGSIAFG